MKKFLDRIKELEKDLKLNTSMLAKQCDLAREAETRAMELKEGIKYTLNSFIWSHDHWDRTGQHGVGCEICQEQTNVRRKLSELLEKK